jgi:hypothetical protein
LRCDTYTVPKLKDFSPAALERAVADLLHALESEWAAVRTQADSKTFRDRWMGSKNGILTQVSSLWLKAAPTPAKPDVKRWVNELRHRMEKAVETSRKKVKTK